MKRTAGQPCTARGAAAKTVVRLTERVHGRRATLQSGWPLSDRNPHHRAGEIRRRERRGMNVGEPLETYARIHGRTLHADLRYPRSRDRPNEIEVELVDVRAADALKISFDFERNGWRIGMDLTCDDDSGIIHTVAENQEVAFIPAWNEQPTAPTPRASEEYVEDEG